MAPISTNTNFSYILPIDICRVRRKPSIVIVTWPIARIGIVFGYSCACTTGQVHAFRDLGTDGVVLVGGNGDGHQDGENGNDNHQCNESEAVPLADDCLAFIRVALVE